MKSLEQDGTGRFLARLFNLERDDGLSFVRYFLASTRTWSYALHTGAIEKTITQGWAQEKSEMEQLCARVCRKDFFSHADVSIIVSTDIFSFLRFRILRQVKA